VRAIAPFSIVVDKQFGLDPEDYRQAVAALAEVDADRILSKLGLDFHAGFFETSVALALAPHTVDELYRELPPCPRVPPSEPLLRMARVAERLGQRRMAMEMHHAALAANWSELRPFPGYTSEPALACAEAGEVFVEAIVEEYERAMSATLLRGAAPPVPPMGWMRSLTLGGRLAPAPPHGVVTTWQS
jgi:creatinine amidohydrolase